MKPFFKFAMLALVLVAVALVSALMAMRFAIHGQVVEVPAVVGLTPADAERAVAGLGLQIEVERQYYSPRIPEGRIMTQLPPPGAKVRRGWQLRVAQSLGPQRVVIPDVTKQSERAADWNIRRRGLEVASTAEMQLPGTPPDEREPGGGTENQPAGQRGRQSAGLRDAEFCRAVAGCCEPHTTRCGLQAGQCEHGAAGSGRGGVGYSSACACRATSAFTSKYDRYAMAADWAESFGGRGG
jgi:PASTA domain